MWGGSIGERRSRAPRRRLDRRVFLFRPFLAGDRSFEGLRKYLTGHVSKPAAEAAEAAEVAEPKAAKEEL